MQNKFLLKIALGLFAMVLSVPAMARDFTPREPSLKQSGHWAWDWDGTDGLGVSIAATVHYVPGGPARISVTGPDELLQKLRIGQGQIRWCEDCSINGGKLDITVSGVTLHSVALHGGGGDIQLGRLDQDRLHLAISGSGRMSAGGRIDQVNLAISGSGNVSLSDASVQRANVAISGSGDVDVTPRDDANISVSGSGNIRMKAMPAHLNQKISGSGGVRIAGK
jgi:hypothetical protein